MPARDVAFLLSLMESAYRRSSWHGTNLRGSLKGLTAEEALRRPAPGRHNAWELAVHCAYWKYVALRKLTGEKRGSFPVKGSNWFPREAPMGESEWKRDLALLHLMHTRLVEESARLSPARLSQRVVASRRTHWELLTGVASHDLYHAGQIQLLKRLTERT
jgi:uncharacterized damage-inducible protein DinB